MKRGSALVYKMLWPPLNKHCVQIMNRNERDHGVNVRPFRKNFVTLQINFVLETRILMRWIME